MSSDSTTERLLFEVIQGQKEELIKKQKVITRYRDIVRDLRTKLEAQERLLK